MYISTNVYIGLFYLQIHDLRSTEQDLDYDQYEELYEVEDNISSAGYQVSEYNVSTGGVDIDSENYDIQSCKTTV